MNKKIILSLAFIFLAVTLVFSFATKKQTEDSSIGGNADAAVNLIGTRVGTSTTGVAFTSTGTPITYRKMISGDVDTAVLNIKTTAASAATVNINVLASNDVGCDTATTTGTGERISDINWYDAGYLAKDLAYTTTIAAATTTFVWQPTGANQGKQIVLTDIIARCLRFDVAATSTTLYASLRTKKN